MRPNSGIALASLEAWEALPEISSKAEAQNLVFEERVSPSRQGEVEQYFISSGTPAELQAELAEYWREEVILAEVPAPFRASTGAGIPTPSAEQKLIRFETLTDVLDKTGLTFSDLDRLVRDNKSASERTLDWFFEQWNTRPDIRKNPVSFATFKDQHLADLRSPDWPTRLRDRLGLAHYDCSAATPVAIALMEYEVEEVLAHASTLANLVQPFAVPSALDQRPYCYFYPTPQESRYGCPMNLQPIQSENDLVAEVLHPRLPYKRKHLRSLALMAAPIPTFALDELRNNHLLAIRFDSGRLDFGAEI